MHIVDSTPLNSQPSVFRTEAWVQAWIDVWGDNPQIVLIDLGEKKNPLEYVYREKSLVKKILPVSGLHLAGVGCSKLPTPRSEYNDINGLIALFGSVQTLGRQIAKLKWQEFVVPDVIDSGDYTDPLKDLSLQLNANLYVKKVEPAYHVKAEDFKAYLSSLGANTRLKYFNRRETLAAYGEIEKRTYSVREGRIFFKVLNDFHIKRWGCPCYSDASQAFMINFQERLSLMGGEAIMESLAVNGEIVSVIFDIVWVGRRYNFQSGYLENRFKKISLGAIHLGYSIESAIECKQTYDFMAGYGKSTNYKASISNCNTKITVISIQRGYFKDLAVMYELLSYPWRGNKTYSMRFV